MSEDAQGWERDSPERLYVITGGRSDASEGAGAELDLVTLIVARTEPKVGMQPEHTSILQVTNSPLSVAEISAYLGLPVSVITVLLADLLSEEQVEAREPASSLPDVALIEAVIHGLRNL
ncbi:DUF742 domain-containing protein [Streptomyces sp. NPDC048639]|uniref:DUF742 domain-containing protein n=1 Tax=Streptomyces sp. NPDC048639 TaxID=3365581 RepID=UPI00371DDFD2